MGYEADDYALSEGRKEFGNMFGFLGPRNMITADNSAIHYNSSPYSYVLNNPLIYNDPFGLDTNKVNQLDEVTVTGYRNNFGVPHWLGPSMIALGEPIVFLKPVGALGSQPGSSIASYTLSKVFPQNIPALKQAERKVIGVVSKKAAKKAGTAVLGRFLGRMVPGVGWVITSYDILDNKEAVGLGIGAFSSGAGDYYKLRSDPQTFYMFAK
ncbi:hypothetical protein ACFQRK_20055 [Parapedobacter sp. GCM10030251]|uniref:hypothetical protein n=1 Tax=Parapedobacter sp. GCM10030251 TaxID=3273419 RepID=UPI00362416BA